MQWITIAMAIALIVAAAAALLLLWKRSGQAVDRKAARNVVELSSYRKARKSAGKQKCSLCQKESGRLAYYADEYGRAIGVCDKCKTIAERRELLRL